MKNTILKILSIILILAIVTILAGCGGIGNTIHNNYYCNCEKNPKTTYICSDKCVNSENVDSSEVDVDSSEVDVDSSGKNSSKVEGNSSKNHNSSTSSSGTTTEHSSTSESKVVTSSSNANSNSSKVTSTTIPKNTIQWWKNVSTKDVDPIAVPKVCTKYKVLKRSKSYTDPNAIVTKELKTANATVLKTNKNIGCYADIFWADLGHYDDKASDMKLKVENGKILNVQYINAKREIFYEDLGINSTEYLIKKSVKGITTCYALVDIYDTDSKTAYTAIFYITGTLDNFQ